MRTLTFNRILGVGAMGTVYLAELRGSRGSAHTCAVKVIGSTNPDQEQFRARMRDEARLLSLLKDEQILGVSELVQAGGRDCLVMEFVDGMDLGEFIRDPANAAPSERPVARGSPEGEGTRRARLPAKALAELGAELAGTLHRAHSAVHPTTGEPLRVIHRDVKPANVMVTARGAVRLLDFGVARAAFASRESNTQGLVLGTLNYFPPEVMAGAEPTPSVDLYGLGLTLWECASGADWGSPQVHRHRFERRVEQRLAELQPDYEPLVTTLRRLLAWRPGDRPSGTQAEKLLLSASELCSGAGIRAWARLVVPPMLEKRRAAQPTDALVGQTLPIKADTPSSPPPRPASAQPAQAQAPAPKSSTPKPAEPRSPEPRRRAPPPVGLQSIDPEILRQAAAHPNVNMTFNDLAPPAAVMRPTAENRPETPSEPMPVPDLALDPATEEAAAQPQSRPSELPTTRLKKPGREDSRPIRRRNAAPGLGPTVLWLSFSALMGVAVGAGVLVIIVAATWLVVN